MWKPNSICLTMRLIPFIAAPALLLGAVMAAESRGPNLLFIQTDEQRADTMAAYENNKIRTPNLDRLASESFVFTRAYVAQPVCTPARSTMITGLWPHTTGLTSNNIPLPDSPICVPERLADPEYRTAFMGKWHLGDEIFPQHGFDQWVSIEDIYSRHYREGRDRNARSSYHHFLLKLGYEPENGNRFSRGFAARRPIEHCKPKFLEREACAFLQQHQHESFVLYVSFLEPHMPFYGPLDGEYKPEEVTLPINFNNPLEEDEPEEIRSRRDQLFAKGFDGERLRTESDWRKLIARYWGLVTQVDRSVGAILDTLDRLGLAENTIVVYTSDHGDMMGSHRLLTKGLVYEESVRVPWLMRIPELVRHRRKIERPVSHIDMVPTLLDLMGKEVPEELPGHSLVPLMTGGDVVEDHVFIEWPKPPWRTVISPDGWKLCLRKDGKCQLYNLKHDPGECTNLYYNGRHQDVIGRLTAKIREWQKRVGDTADLRLIVRQ